MMPQSSRCFAIAVRDLVQWSPAAGQHLPGFPFHWRGMMGRRTQSRIRDLKPEWQHETAVSAEIRVGPFLFTVTGKIDLLFRTAEETIIEEIKTVILPRSVFKKLQPDAYPHFAEQLLFYCQLYHLAHPGQRIRPRLTIINLINDQSYSEDLAFEPEAVGQLLIARLKSKINALTMARRMARVKARLVRKLTFVPAPDRPYQVDMINGIAEGVGEGAHLLISAPTGSGKTMAALYPVIRYALGHQKRIFYLTAKNTQHDAVARNLSLLLGRDFPFTTLFLRAREKMCANSVYFCHTDHCPYAADYFSRVQSSGITAELAALRTIFPEDVFPAAAGRMLCPAEVQFTLARQADLIVGDYNYIFDPALPVQSLFYHNAPGDWILVIDEAHNLYPRAMELLSPSLSYTETERLYRDVRGRSARVYRQLGASLLAIRDILHRKQQDAAATMPHQQAVLTELHAEWWRDAFDAFEKAYLQYLLHRIRYHQLTADDPIEHFYHRLRTFIHILQAADDAFTPFLSAEQGGTLKIQCCDPAGYLSARIDPFHSVIAQSATLDPVSYYAAVLGFRAERTRYLQLAYPFQTGRRRIILVPEYDTRYRQRYQYYPKYAEMIKNIISLRPGNYIVFFPSFEVLQATNLFLGSLPVQRLIQQSQMTERAREEVTEAMKESDPPKLLLAVTGGIFAEGIDLPGEACIGVIVFGPSLPAVTPERELIRAYYERSGEDGFARAYIYPGMMRVIQAAGRLIRSDQDYGILVLVGDRLADPLFSDLFPDYWGDLIVATDYQTPLAEFWQKFRT